jgi:hypothetical protein
LPVFFCFFYGSVTVEARGSKEAIEKASAMVKEDPARFLRFVSEEGGRWLGRQ